MPVPLAAAVTLPAVLVEKLGHRGAAGEEGLQAATETTEGQPATCSYLSSSWGLDLGCMSWYQLHSQESRAQARAQGSSVSRQKQSRHEVCRLPSAAWHPQKAGHSTCPWAVAWFTEGQPEACR